MISPVHVAPFDALATRWRCAGDALATRWRRAGDALAVLKLDILTGPSESEFVGSTALSAAAPTLFNNELSRHVRGLKAAFRSRIVSMLREFKMASKVFDGSASIVLNTKGEIALKKDPNGNFNAGNATECYNTLRSLAKARTASINKYSLLVVDNGTEPVMLANRYGNPYIALLPKRDGGGNAKRAGVTKLA